MSLARVIVQKYGGATVADEDKLAAVARHVIATAAERPTAVVVSAMGDMTDELIARARRVYPSGPRHAWERMAAPAEDIAAMMLAGAIAQQGGRVVDVNTHQVGVVAAEDGSLREIRAVDLIKDRLAEGNVVVLPGYKGVTPDGSTKPLGRGASDLLAIALGIPGHLNAEEVVILKDEDGLSPTDPKVVPGVRIFDELTYPQALRVSNNGPLMNRAIELAQNHGVPVRVMRSPSIGASTGGTLIRNFSTPQVLEPPRRDVVILRVHRATSLVRIGNIPNRPGEAFRVFNAVRAICLGRVIQDQGTDTATISFTVDTDKVTEVREKVAAAYCQAREECGDAELRKAYDRVEVQVRDGYAGLSLIDPRMEEASGYMADVSEALWRASVNIAMISAPDDHIHVSCAPNQLQPAAQALAAKYGMLKQAA